MEEEYEEYSIEKATVQFLKSDGTKEASEPFGCAGNLSVDPETQQVVKKCGVETLKTVTKIAFLNVKLDGHIKRNVAREIFGLTNERLKKGVYALDRFKLPKDFILTAEVWNLDHTERKLVAFPNITNVKGFIKNIDNAATELAYISLELNALFDKNNKAYYEAYVTEVEDEEVVETWLEEFSPELVVDNSPTA